MAQENNFNSQITWSPLPAFFCAAYAEKCLIHDEEHKNFGLSLYCFVCFDYNEHTGTERIYFVNFLCFLNGEDWKTIKTNWNTADATGGQVCV